MEAEISSSSPIKTTIVLEEWNGSSSTNLSRIAVITATSTSSISLQRSGSRFVEVSRRIMEAFVPEVAILASGQNGSSGHDFGLTKSLSKIKLHSVHAHIKFQFLYCRIREFLNMRNAKWLGDRDPHKLGLFFYESFEVITCIGKVAYKLALPLASKLHPVLPPISDLSYTIWTQKNSWIATFEATMMTLDEESK
ncbi:hypothetical protein GIB67_000647 [Kingdonia uniflora]|uniref:Uncharacterized protein n=1 Tax=Kingdonia uniflora TaxID=39325 RepID=A0A7J7NDA7_9MAGN|nr:hypothetical protein GIB67_000647 [Kingdonia uniflora]